MTDHLGDANKMVPDPLTARAKALWLRITNGPFDEYDEADIVRIVAFARAERAAALEEAEKIAEKEARMAIEAEQRYRAKHGTEELNGIRMSERVEFALTAVGISIAQAIREAQDHAQ